jgi:hypothetical protein
MKYVILVLSFVFLNACSSQPVAPMNCRLSCEYESLFAQLYTEATGATPGFRDFLVGSVDGYEFSYRFHDSESTYVVAYGSGYAVSTGLSYATEGGVYNGYSPEDYLAIEKLALHLGQLPILERAQKVDQAYSMDSSSNAREAQLDRVFHDHIVGQADLASEKSGYLYQEKEGLHLVITRILTLGKIHKINLVVVDDESRMLLDASLRIPREVVVEKVLLSHAQDLVWKVFELSEDS